MTVIFFSYGFGMVLVINIGEYWRLQTTLSTNPLSIDISPIKLPIPYVEFVSH